MPDSEYHCSVCGMLAKPERRSYRDLESGLPNLILHGIEIAECSHCGNSDIIIPYPIRIHRAIALAILKSPHRMTGPQLRFLRVHLGVSEEEFGAYVQADTDQLIRWERDEEAIPPSTDRFLRLLATAIDEELKPSQPQVLAHFARIGDESGDGWEIHIDVATLEASYVRLRLAA